MKFSLGGPDPSHDQNYRVTCKMFTKIRWKMFAGVTGTPYWFGFCLSRGEKKIPSYTPLSLILI